MLLFRYEENKVQKYNDDDAKAFLSFPIKMQFQYLLAKEP